jgi:hypothetical protein
MNYYQQKDNLVGSSYTRAKEIHIINSCDSPPVLEWAEEEVISIGDKVVKNNLGTLVTRFNPLDQIPKIDTDTNQPTGEYLSPEDIYKALYSAYIYYAKERDKSS